MVIYINNDFFKKEVKNKVEHKLELVKMSILLSTPGRGGQKFWL